MSYEIAYDGDDHTDLLTYAEVIGPRRFIVQMVVWDAKSENKLVHEGFLHEPVAINTGTWLMLVPIREREDEVPVEDLDQAPLLIDPDRVTRLRVI